MSRTLLASDELGAIAGDLGVVTEALMALQAREEGTVKPSSRAFVALQVTSARFRGLSSPILNLAPTSSRGFRLVYDRPIGLRDRVAGSRTMNRHARRAAAAQGRAGDTRADALRAAIDYLRSAPDTATGATILLPDGEQVYVSRQTADAMTPPSDTRSDQMEAIHREAAGLMHLDVVMREDMPAMIAAASRGASEAAELFQRVNAALLDILSAPKGGSKLCAVCPQPLADGRYSLALATPACDAPSNALALAVCHDCASAREDVRAKAIEALRRVWPDARPVTVTHPRGGRA